MKKVKVVIGTLFILGLIGIVFISAYRYSESYRKKQAGNVEPSDVVNMSNSGDVVDTDEVQVVVNENDTDVDNATEIAVVNGPYGSIQLEVPDTWEFEICDVDDDRLGVASYGILLKPANETYGIIEVGYCDGFGVCGTGLETKSVTLADNEAHIGYYDGSNNWNYISWVDQDSDLKNITVLCNADWGATYLDELLEILNSIQFDKENQTGGIGIYEPSSELGIDEGYLSVSAKNISSTSATLVFNYLTYRDNEADESNELYYGSYLPISKKVGGSWIELEYAHDGEIAFEDVAYIIKENEKTTFDYDWEWLYGSLEPGEYQIAIEINSEVMIYAYFILR